MTFPDEARPDLYRLWSVGHEGVGMEGLCLFAKDHLAENGWIVVGFKLPICKYILTKEGRELAAITWATHAERPMPVDSSIAHPRLGHIEMYTGPRPFLCSDGSRGYEVVPEKLESLFRYLWVNCQTGVAFKVANSEGLGVLYRNGLVGFVAKGPSYVPIFTMTRHGEEVARIMFCGSDDDYEDDGEDDDDDDDDDGDVDVDDDGEDDWKDGWYQPLLVTPTVWNESKQVFEKGRAYRVQKDGTREYMKEPTVGIAPGEELGMLPDAEDRRVLALVVTSLNSADSDASARRVLAVVDLIYGRVPQSAEIPVTIEECSRPEDDGPVDNEAKVEPRDCKEPSDGWPA